MQTDIELSVVDSLSVCVARCVRGLSCALVVAASLVTASVAYSAEIYKYKNAEGVWVFTDEKPEGKDYSEAKPNNLQRLSKVAVVNRGTKDKPKLYAVSKVAGPVEVWLDFTQNTNVKFSQSKPFNWVVSGPGDELLLEMEAENAESEWSYGWRASFVPGAPVSQSSLTKAALGVPTKGGPFVVSQAFDGVQSHKDYAEAGYAVDVAVPENTPVIAVQSGTVMDTGKDFSRAGWSALYSDEAKMVRVLHRDGSMGLYAHFRLDGVQVKPGQKVRKGQLLGYSGGTGLTPSPHVHFALQINSGEKLVSVPFVFEGYDRQPRKGDIVGPN